MLRIQKESVFLLGLSLSLGACNVHAMTICIENQDSPPLSYVAPHPPGHAQILINEAAKNLNISIAMVFKPWKQCQLLVGNGTYDALFAAAYAGINVQLVEFPKISIGVPDRSKAIGTMKIYLIRRKGSNADYVGGSFVNLNAPVGINSGYQLSMVEVTKGGALFDNGTSVPEQQAQKLIFGRTDLVASDVAFIRLVNERYMDKLEVLPSILTEAVYYLAFASKYYKAHKNEVETYWNEIAKVSNSAPYKAKIETSDGIVKP